jgi:hypothetical protein
MRVVAVARFLLFVFALGALAGCGIGRIDIVDAPSPEVGLVAYWTFDEGSGTSVPDHSGNGHDGVLTGGSWITAGRSGGALYLTRGDYVTVAGFPSATPDWTVSAWVRYAQTDIGSDLATILSTEFPKTGGWEMQGPVNGETSELEFGYSRPNGLYANLICCQIEPDQWMHLTAVVDSQRLSLTLYQGGVVQISESVQSLILPGNGTLHIGIEQTPTVYEWPLQGAVDEIRIYNRALNAAEVLRLDTAP